MRLVLSLAFLLLFSSVSFAEIVSDQAPGSNPVQSGPGAKAFNPDISVIGNFFYYGGSNPNNPLQPNTLRLDETELGFEAAVDPYADAKFFITLPMGGTVGVEEGYINLRSLPLGVLAKVGKFRSDFGRVNTQHPHARAYADNPLVITSYFGDSLNESGISLSRLIDNPWNLYSELTVEVTSGENPVSFGSVIPGHALMTLAHWSTFFELTETSDLLFGLSDAYGQNASATATAGNFTNLAGINLLYRNKPDSNHQFVIEAEGLISNYNTNLGATNTGGYFIYAGYSPDRYWDYGLRYDNSQSSASTSTQTQICPIITYRASEFAYYRLQYNFITLPNNVRANEVYVQVNWSIGAHGAHAY